MSEERKSNNVVNVGDHIIIQRKNHMKLHKLTTKNSVMIGNDKLIISEIIGKPFWTTFKMESVKKGEFVLSECTDLEEVAEQLIKDSGEDNRNICDDGSSQKLSKAEIIDLRDSGLSSNEILGHIVGNSKTFMNKTEYSQEKYLKKKEKKYFDYITIRQPTIRLINDILYNLDPSKLLGLRVDTISQITTAINMHSDGTYILFESGCQGIVAATMLNCISEGGNLVHIHPGNTPQKQAVSAMNFEENQLERLLSVNIYSLLHKLQENIPTEHDASKKGSIEECVTNLNEQSTAAELAFKSDATKNTILLECENANCLEVKEKSRVITEINDKLEGHETSDKKRKLEEDLNEGESCNKKTKVTNDVDALAKKPRWELRTEKAAKLLQSKNVDGLVIVAKEHPTNIIDALLPFVAISKPFIVFSPYREILQDLYVHLKTKYNVADLWLTETWLRAHQVLPERTHPDVLMSSSGGYLLTGILVEG